MKKTAIAVSFAAAVGVMVWMRGCDSDQEAAVSKNLGSVDSTVRWFTPDDRIDVDYLEGPDIDGITLYVSKAEKGGLWSIVGMEEDTSDISVASRQTGPIVVKNPIEK